MQLRHIGCRIVRSRCEACLYAFRGFSRHKLPVIRAQQANIDSKELHDSASQGRRAAILCLAAALFTTAASTSSANAGIIEELLEKSKENK
ncbi:unnamed protein product, partial [Ilex paraguariensis]